MKETLRTILMNHPALAGGLFTLALYVQEGIDLVGTSGTSVAGP